jgi:ABC-type sugar transport system ATPase subunit
MLARIIAERELAKGAEVLLLSDPSAGLDLQALNALLLKIRAFADEGGAALFFLGGVPANDPGGTPELAEICDRVYYIANGRLLPDNRATAQTGAAAPKETHRV